MPDKVSRSKNAVDFIEKIEHVSLRALEAADKISFRLLLYALALRDVYRYFMSKH
jgi:hypothetical protein